MIPVFPSRKLFAPLAAAVLALGACDDGTSPGDARVRVLLTDAPIDYVEAAWVDIGAVALVPAGEGGPVVLTDDGTDGPVNLLELQSAATHLLADAEIEAGDYAQLRLIVESATVELVEGYTFTDGSTERELTVPSGAQTGIKLNLHAAGEDGDGPVTIGGETVLVLDFDVGRSFVIQGAPDTPAGIQGMLFTPTIRVVVEDVAATVSGTVATELEDVPVSGLTVTAEPLDEGTLEEYQTKAGTAVTDEDGNYTIYFLVPGTYEIGVETPDGTEADPVEIELERGEDVDEVDFDLVAASGS